MIPTFDILIGRLLMHEHSEYVLKSDPGFKGIFDTPVELPDPSQDGDFALVRSTGTIWWWNKNIVPAPGAWENTYTPPESITFIEEVRLVTPPEAASGALLLVDAPRLDQNIDFTVVGAAPNTKSVHFTVTGNLLNWASGSLYGILSAGDTVSIKYYK